MRQSLAHPAVEKNFKPQFEAVNSATIMKKSIIKLSNGPPTGGPYSQCVRVDDLLFCSGQIPILPETGELVVGEIRKQTERVLENISMLLHDQGLTLDNVVKTTVFMTDLADFSSMNEVYARFFIRNPPARTTVQVAALPRRARIEIEAVAHY
jgi:2-iminobutanoate/2-iminopropanoate deaminase